MKNYFSLDSIDAILESSLLDYDNGYFIELGGNDGISQSNTLYFEKYRGWRGFLVEPILHNYFKCKENRKASQVFCNACVSFEYKSSCVELLYSNLMTSPLGVETDLDPKAQAHLGNQFLDQSEEVVRTAAIAATLDQLMREASAPKCVDFLSVDVEGAEAEVIKGIDFCAFSFRVICIEARDPSKIISLLATHGYKWIRSIGHNLVLIHPKHVSLDKKDDEMAIF